MPIEGRSQKGSIDSAPTFAVLARHLLSTNRITTAAVLLRNMPALCVVSSKCWLYTFIAKTLSKTHSSENRDQAGRGKPLTASSPPGMQQCVRTQRKIKPFLGGQAFEWAYCTQTDAFTVLRSQEKHSLRVESRTRYVQQDGDKHPSVGCLFGGLGSSAK